MRHGSLKRRKDSQVPVLTTWACVLRQRLVEYPVITGRREVTIGVSYQTA
jgi:hypothetical protein